MEKLRALLNQKNNAKILDVGTGNGNFIRILTALNNQFSEIIGIDLIEVAIEVSKKNFEDDRINFFKMDALNMEFKDDTFDFVCLSNSLHHLEDIPSILKEMERVLKPDGALIFCEMMSNGLDKRQKSHLLMHHYAAEVDEARGRFHNRTFTNKKILEILKKDSSLKITGAWDLTYPKRDENSTKELEWLFETLDRLKESSSELDNKEYLNKEAEKVKKHIRKYGFDSATQLIVVLK